MKIRTVAGDIAPELAGPTYAHEHLIIDSGLVADRWPHISLPSVDEAVAELTLCAQAGVQTVVDAMPLGAGGNIEKLGAISARTTVNVVATTGMHTVKYYEGVKWASDPVEDLVTRFTNDITASPGCGVIKLATTGPIPSAREVALFAAGVETHRLTRVPIITHCEDGAGGLEQVALLPGVDPTHVILSHTDKVDDAGYHRDLLQTGVNLVYDQALRREAALTTAALTAAMWEEGFGGQILLGTDGARRTLWSTLGGSPGLAWLKEGFAAVLESHGLGPAELEAMFVTNPARALAF